MPDSEVRAHLATLNLQVNPGLASKKSGALLYAISAAARLHQIGRQANVKRSNVNGKAHRRQSGVDSKKREIAV
jgi:hypothetical protein